MSLVISHCKKGWGLSECCAHSSHDSQKECFYYRDATNAKRCMFLVFDEYCDNWEAQYDNSNVGDGNRPGI